MNERAVSHMMKLVAAVMVFGSALAAFDTQARSVYRWVDKNGLVHYDDTNSGGTKMTREYMDDRVIPDEPEWKGVIPGELVAEVKQRCSNASERLANYRAAPVIYGRDPSGNVYTLSPNQSRLMLAEIQAEADRYCGADAPRRIFEERRAQAKAERSQRAAGG